MRIWDYKNETMSVKEIEQLQIERLQSTVYRIYRHGVTLYRKKFTEAGFDPENLESLKDLEKLPLTTREDLKESYPYDMFAVPLREVVRIHETSGDMGIVGYTTNDLKNWSGLVARALCSSGIDENDTVQITHPYGLFPGAFGYHFAAELIGASVIPSSTANTDKQLRILKDYRSTAIITTPSYASRLIGEMKNRGIDPKTMSLKYAVLGSEPWTENIRNEIEQGLFVSALFNYGVASIFGPGIASECREKNGLHIFMDHFIAEIIDPKTGKALPNGNEGELVLTTLTREAFPVLRFRTGDITTLYYDNKPCICGRTHIKMQPVKRRVDELFVYNGMNIYPRQVSDFFITSGIKSPIFRIELKGVSGRDFMDIQIEVTEGTFFDEMKMQKEFMENLARRFEREFEAMASIRFVERGSLKGKKKIEDKR